LAKDKPLKVLDLGCGTGVIVRQLSKCLHADSQLYGADISRELLNEATRLCFDVIIMHTLLSHVENPLEVLSEARRVLKEDGRLIVFDADHAGTTYNQADYETTRRTDYLLTTAIATNPDICRQLPVLLKDSGYQLCDHSVDVISECGKGDYWLSSVKGFARLMPSIDALSADEADSWVTHMMQSHDNGTFFASGAFYTFFAKADKQAR